LSSANNFDLDMSGFVGGGQIGYNWMVTPAVLLGFEADIQTAQQKGHATISSLAGIITESVESRLRWFGTARGRLAAVTNGATLWYLTGGLAYGKAEMERRGIETHGQLVGEGRPRLVCARLRRTDPSDASANAAANFSGLTGLVK
jgi:opacity protein-like surface antigen